MRRGRFAILATLALSGGAAAFLPSPGTGPGTAAEHGEAQPPRVSPVVALRWGGALPDAETTAWIRDVAARAGLGAGLPWSVHLLDEPRPDVFTLPGGSIHITRGALALLESEAELAALMRRAVGRVTVHRATLPAARDPHASRAVHMVARAADRPAGDGTREDYLDRIDGLRFGPDPRDGYLRGSGFVHPRMGLRWEVPAGYRIEMLPYGTVASGPREATRLTLREDAARDPAAAARAFVSGAPDVRRVLARSSTEIGGRPARMIEYRDGRERSGLVAFVAHPGRVVRVDAEAPSEIWGEVRGEVLNSIRSLERVLDRTLLDVRPHRIEIVEAPRAMTGLEFLDAFPPGIDPNRALDLNRIERTSRIPAGTRLKWVHGGRPDHGLARILCRKLPVTIDERETNAC